MKKLPVSDRLSPKAMIGIALAPTGVTQMPTPRIVQAIFPRHICRRDANASMTCPLPDDYQEHEVIIGSPSIRVECVQTSNSIGQETSVLSGIAVSFAGRLARRCRPDGKTDR